VIRHPLLEIPRHSSQSLIINRHVVGVHAEDLRPAFASRVFEVEVYVCEGLVDLRVNFFGEYACLGVPSTWRKRVVLAIILGDNRGLVGFLSPCPAHSMRSPTRTA
jgi:hypothetical protein